MFNNTDQPRVRDLSLCSPNQSNCWQELVGCQKFLCEKQYPSSDTATCAVRKRLKTLATWTMTELSSTGVSKVLFPKVAWRIKPTQTFWGFSSVSFACLCIRCVPFSVFMLLLWPPASLTVGQVVNSWFHKLSFATKHSDFVCLVSDMVSLNTEANLFWKNQGKSKTDTKEVPNCFMTISLGTKHVPKAVHFHMCSTKHIYFADDNHLPATVRLVNETLLKVSWAKKAE